MTIKKDITETIKSFADAMQATGRPDVPDFSNLPEDLRTYFENQYKMAVITEALNEGWNPDWADGGQQKWFPWFYHKPKSSSGFAFGGTIYRLSAARAGDGARLCFRTKALATYAGEQFLEIWNAILLK